MLDFLFSTAAAPPPPVDGDFTTNISGASVSSVTHNGDGTSTIVIAGSSLAGSYNVQTADFLAAQSSGTPFYISGLVVTENPSGTWTADASDLLYMVPVDDIGVPPLVSLERNGNLVAGFTGNSYTLDPDGIDEFVQVRLGVTLINNATAAAGVRAMTEIQPEVAYTAQSFRAVGNATLQYATSSPAAPAVDRLVVAAWFDAADTSGNHWIMDTGDTYADADRVMDIRHGTGTSWIATPGNPAGNTLGAAEAGNNSSTFTVGSTNMVLFSFEVGGNSRGFLSTNGSVPVNELTRTIAPGESIALSYDAIRFLGRLSGFNRFDWPLYRMAIWSPTSIPDFTNPDIYGRLMDSEGKPRFIGLADQILGPHLFNLDQRPTTGEFTGLWRSIYGLLTVNGTFEDVN